jgi:hypothetical protein
MAVPGGTAPDPLLVSAVPQIADPPMIGFTFGPPDDSQAEPVARLLPESIRRAVEQVVAPVLLWCYDRRDRVRASYLVLRDWPVIRLHVVGTAEAYDFALGEELSAFVLSLADRGWRVLPSLIPACDADELTAFLNPSHALPVT